MLRRPRPGEDEADILKMQEEFLSEKHKNKDLKPAARVVDLRDQPSIPAGSKRGASNEPRKPSKYAQAKGLTDRTEKRARSEASGSLMGDILEKNVCNTTFQQEDMQDDKVYYPKVISLVMGNIVEKNNSHSDMDLSQPALQSMPAKGFPVVKKRDPKISSGAKSIFSQMMELERAEKSSTTKLQDRKCNSDVMDVDLEISSQNSKTSPLNVPSKSFILTSEHANSIHQQNVEVLSKMSESEILDEQKKLLTNLDPEIINFLKSRRMKQTETKMETEIANEKSKPAAVQADATTAVDVPSKEHETTDTPDSLWDNDILSHPHVDRWLHFESLEKDKLAWMKGLEESKNQKGDEPYEARFDFKGYLLPYTMEYTEQTKTLFHHGEEPHRPGYSLVELFELSRSSVIQQRIMALNTIAGVLEYYSTGIYQGVIDIPLTKIFFVIRFAMDENKVSILEPALRAMRNLLFNRVDEACLDALLGLEEGQQQPCLEHGKSEVTELESKESELKDFHLAEIDLIAGALRTDILQRLQYILDMVKPTFNCVQYCLQIITRLVRDSAETALKIANSERLMNCIVLNFVPITGINFAFNSNICYNNKPVLAAVKLLRVLSLQSAEVAQILIKKYNILEPMCAYVTSGVDGTYGLKLQMEALATLTNVLTYEVGTDQVLALTPVLTMSLYKHVNGTDMNINSSVISATHCAVLIQLVCKLLTADKAKNSAITEQVYPLMKQGINKWMSQLCTVDIYSSGHLRLVCATLDCVKTIIQIEGTKSANDGGLQSILKLFANSKGFKSLLKHLLSSSNMLSNIDNKQIHSTKNLLNLGGSVVDARQKVLPVFSFSSPLLFLTSLVKLLDCLNDSAVAALFVDHMWFYLSKIRTEELSLCENWFTRIETEFLFYLLKVVVKIAFAEPEKDLVYAVANKMCYIFRADKEEELNFLFQNIVFNKHWFTAERLMNLISLNDTNLFTKTMTSIDQIRLCYSKTVNVSYENTGHSIILRNWQQPILPRDWIYLPIVKLYSEHQDIENVPEVHGIHARKIAAMKAAEKESIVSCCLEWILFNELCFMNLLKDINTTDRFCRIMCVYLCDNSLFLEKNIKILLEKCIETIFQREKTSPFNFDKDLTGLHNFQDFYTQFLEHFQAVSYGDSTFAACVLVPLAQKHNIKWRKLVWSEYAGCLRALDCPENKLCYDISDYLYPEETDESLVKSYVQALSSSLLRANTVSFKIAAHHVNSFRKKKAL